MDKNHQYFLQIKDSSSSTKKYLSFFMHDRVKKGSQLIYTRKPPNIIYLKTLKNTCKKGDFNYKQSLKNSPLILFNSKNINLRFMNINFIFVNHLTYIMTIIIIFLNKRNFFRCTFKYVLELVASCIL